MLWLQPLFSISLCVPAPETLTPAVFHVLILVTFAPLSTRFYSLPFIHPTCSGRVHLKVQWIFGGILNIIYLRVLNSLIDKVLDRMTIKKNRHQPIIRPVTWLIYRAVSQMKSELWHLNYCACANNSYKFSKANKLIRLLLRFFCFSFFLLNLGKRY